MGISSATMGVLLRNAELCCWGGGAVCLFGPERQRARALRPPVRGGVPASAAKLPGSPKQRRHCPCCKAPAPFQAPHRRGSTPLPRWGEDERRAVPPCPAPPSPAPSCPPAPRALTIMTGSIILTWAQNTLEARPRTLFIRMSRPPVWLTPSATAYRASTVRTPCGRLLSGMACMGRSGLGRVLRGAGAEQGRRPPRLPPPTRRARTLPRRAPPERVGAPCQRTRGRTVFANPAAPSLIVMIPDTM
jgi:hypothetical protein